MYDIKLLGPGQAYFKGKAINGFPGQQHCLLFYYLLLNRQTPHTREQIATVFWEDESSSVARKNLRNTLWRLHQAFQSVGASLGDLLSIEEEYISFTGTDAIHTDIDQFEIAARSTLNSFDHELSAEELCLLEAAADLYRGDLLEGVYADWCLFERERLRLAYLNILIRLMDHHGGKGNYQRGLEYGQRILALDPTRERSHRQMMMFHWLSGDREAALRQYQSCCDILKMELGLRPVLETEHLYQTILRGSLPSHEQISPASDRGIGSKDQSMDPPLREMLQKLHFLEMIVEQTNTELHLLERMLHQVLDS